MLKIKKVKKEKKEKKKQHPSEELEFMIAERLSYLAKTYDTITQSIAKSRQRLIALGGDRNVKYDTPIQEMESTKGKIARLIEKELTMFPVWNIWLEKVPGIGPFIGAKLILFFNYRHVPICRDCDGDLEKIEGGFVCKDCDKEAKGDGVLKYRIERRDFPNISKWWAYLRRHTVDGVMPKRKAGVVSNWSTETNMAVKDIIDKHKIFTAPQARVPEHDFRADFEAMKASKLEADAELITLQDQIDKQKETIVRLKVKNQALQMGKVAR